MSSQTICHCGNAIIKTELNQISRGLSKQFKDSNEKDHYHDGNIEYHQDLCARGHLNLRKEQKKCWCGYPNDKFEPFNPNNVDLSFKPF